MILCSGAPLPQLVDPVQAPPLTYGAPASLSRGVHPSTKRNDAPQCEESTAHHNRLKRLLAGDVSMRCLQVAPLSNNTQAFFDVSFQAGQLISVRLSYIAACGPVADFVRIASSYGTNIAIDKLRSARQVFLFERADKTFRHEGLCPCTSSPPV